MCEWFQNYIQWHSLESASSGMCLHVAVKDVPHASMKAFSGPSAGKFSGSLIGLESAPLLLLGVLLAQRTIRPGGRKVPCSLWFLARHFTYFPYLLTSSGV